MESWFFNELIDSKSNRKSMLGDAIYDRVKEAIMNNQDSFL